METLLLARLRSGCPAPPENDLRRLACAVILQALRDATGRNEMDRQQAREWLLEDVENFPLWGGRKAGIQGGAVGPRSRRPPGA